MIVSEKPVQIKDPKTVHKLLLGVLKRESETEDQKEHFWALGLNTRNKIVYVDLVSLGTLNSSLVHPRELFRLAVMRAVNSLIVAHNHPSGDPTPSQDDRDLTRRLVEAGHILGIEILDHIIIAGRRRISLKEMGVI